MLCAGLALLALHFTMVCIYANPFNQDGKKTKTGYVAMYYAYPYFHQSWSLFAPPPETNYQLFVQFENNGTIKKEIFNDLLLQHQGNRFKGLEPLVNNFANSIHYFDKNTKLQNTLNGPVSGDINFTILEHTVNKYLQHCYKGPVQNTRIFLFAKDIQTGKQRIYFN